MQGTEFTIETDSIASTTGANANATYTDIRVFTNSPGACDQEYYITVVLLNPCDDKNDVFYGEPIDDVTIYLEN